MSRKLSSCQKLERSVLETLLYFWTEKKPLFLGEIEYFLIRSQKNGPTFDSLRKALDDLSEKGLIIQKKGFYLPKVPGEKNFSWLSQTNRIKEAHKRIELTAKALRWLSKIKMIKEIYLCGSVAGRNCSEQSDIDLLILTNQNRAWSTRFWLTLGAWLFGRKKKDGQPRKNRFCLNHYRDLKHLKLEKPLKDLYSTKEYLQMIRLFGSSTQKCPFLEVNQFWIKKFIIQASKFKPALFTQPLPKKRFVKFNFLGQKIETLLRLIQINKVNLAGKSETIKLDRSRIILENGVIMFHLNPKSPLIAQRFAHLKNKFLAFKNE